MVLCHLDPRFAPPVLDDSFVAAVQQLAPFLLVPRAQAPTCTEYGSAGYKSCGSIARAQLSQAPQVHLLLVLVLLNTCSASPQATFSAVLLAVAYISYGIHFGACEVRFKIIWIDFQLYANVVDTQVAALLIDLKW